MRIERHSDGQSFLEAAESFLLRNEVENALLGVARRLAREPAKDAAPYFALARDGADICGAAVCSRPDLVMITRMPAPACAALALDLLAFGSALPEIAGPEPTAGELARAFATRSGRTAQRRLHMQLYELTHVTLPDPIAPGQLRRARESDLPGLIRWVAAFDAELGESGDAAALARARVASGSFFLWEDGGAPVSMAAQARKTTNGIAVNLVYTPPALRGRGFAGACVGTLSQMLLDQGNRFVCLYADVRNQTANALYRRLGYRPVSHAANYVLHGG